MKTLFSIIILTFFLGCDKNEDIEALNHDEKEFLKSQVLVIDQKFTDDVFKKLYELNKSSINCSNIQCVMNLSGFKEIIEIFDKNVDKIPVFFDYYLYDKRVKEVYDLNNLCYVLIWSLGEKHFSILTNKIKESEKYKTTDLTIELIKAILSEIKSSK